MTLSSAIDLPTESAPESRGHDITIVLGTRPEIIKLADLIHLLGDRVRVIHTGQHWDDGLSGRFLRDRGIVAPIEYLGGLGGRERVSQIAQGITQIAESLKATPCRVVIVQGDTNSSNMGAQAANYLGIPVIHVEAGLRSHDRDMPEEINRLIIGAIADVHCAATPQNAAYLLAAGVDAAHIVITGNTVVEATYAALEEMTEAPAVPDSYILATIHRPENTDDPAALERILHAFTRAPLPVVFAAHPRTIRAIREFDLALANIQVLEPVGHSTFLSLAQNARLIVSDSGGIQEEVTVIKKPLIVVRKSTERPEAVMAGFARLVGPDDSLLASIHEVIQDRSLEERLQAIPSPFGDGSASTTIARIAERLASDSATSFTYVT